MMTDEEREYQDFLDRISEPLTFREPTPEELKRFKEKHENNG